jgi:hypothetical protein
MDMKWGVPVTAIAVFLSLIGLYYWGSWSKLRKRQSITPGNEIPVYFALAFVRRLFWIGGTMFGMAIIAILVTPVGKLARDYGFSENASLWYMLGAAVLPLIIFSWVWR